MIGTIVRSLYSELQICIKQEMDLSMGWVKLQITSDRTYTAVVVGNYPVKSSSESSSRHLDWELKVHSLERKQKRRCLRIFLASFEASIPFIIVIVGHYKH